MITAATTTAHPASIGVAPKRTAACINQIARHMLPQSSRLARVIPKGSSTYGYALTSLPSEWVRLSIYSYTLMSLYSSKRTHMAKKTTSAAPSVDLLVKQSVETVRLNCLIPADLHRRVKAGCANEGVSMTDVVVEFLEGRFPKQ